MIFRVQSWIVRTIAAGGFSAHGDVLRFALSRSVWTTLGAVILNFVVYQVFGRLGILNVMLPPNPWSDIVVTAFVAAPICFMVYYIMGRAIMEVAISRDSFERLSRIDPLTGLLNRRAFTEKIAAFTTPYALAVIDIDRFKAINDTHGHAAGDRVLIEVAEELRLSFGEGVFVARLGGEEFGVAMPDRGRDVSVQLLDNARMLIGRRQIEAGAAQISVTFSAGLSSGGKDEDYSSQLSRADKALYLAKAAGRNRVVHADDVAAVTSLKDSAPQQRAV